jgi:hypothetical protein
MPYPHVIRLRGPWEYEPLARVAPITSTQDRQLTVQSSRFSPLAPGGTGAGNEGTTNAELPPPGRIHLPADWTGTLGKGFRGRVRYRRRFNRPTGLEPRNRVWLVIDGVDACGQHSLNGQPLGSIDGYALPAESDVTELLTASNVLEIDVELNESCVGESRLPAILRPGRELLAGGPIGEVRLEIRAHAFVEDLAVYWEPQVPPRLCICGRIADATSSSKSSSPLAPKGPGANGPALAVTACQRELLYEHVVAGDRFAFSLPIDDWPVWPDAADEPVLTPVEIRLLSGATALWQTVRETAPPQADDAQPRQAMLERMLPAEALDWFDYLVECDARWQQILDRPGSIAGLRAVLPEAAYAALDRANVAVVQQVPVAWTDVVCRRLAHHPSIVAWGISPNDLAAAGPPNTAPIAYGRPWIA